MTQRWRPQSAGGMRVTQSSLPTGPRVGRPDGWALTGVVTAVYVFDSADGLEAFGNAASSYNGVFCDVLCYGRWNGLLRRVRWTADRAGLHEGVVDRPRAASIDLSGTLDFNVSNPATLDGDHVIVSFLENDYSQPYISGFVPHPSSDGGNSGRPVGQRLRVLEGDGHPRFRKHRGVAYGVDSSGNYIIDARRGHGGAYTETGEEPAPPLDGSSGNYELHLPAGSTVTISIEDGATLTLEDKDGNASLTLGDGAVSMAVAEHLETLYTALKARLDAFDVAYAAHTHLLVLPLPGNPTGPASAGTPPGLPISAPPWDSSIASSKVKTPDG